MMKRKSPHGLGEEGSRKRAETSTHSNSHRDNKQSNSSFSGGFIKSLESIEIPNRKSNSPQVVGEIGPRDRVVDGSEKISKLLEALDDMSTIEPGQVDEATLLQCAKLKSALQNQKATRSVQEMPSHNLSISRDKDCKIVPQTDLFSPWTSSSIPVTPPPLPAVKSSSLEARAFTHLGAASSDINASYEKLEWIGDAYIELFASLLISSTFPTRMPGASSQMREKLVKNSTLASYARQYGFEARARLPTEFRKNQKTSTRISGVAREKIMSDMFEAYVAAIILSDPEHGVNRAASWLKALWAREVFTEIVDQERTNAKRAILVEMGDPLSNRNAKDALQNKLISKGVRLNYKDTSPEKVDPQTGFLIFTIGVYLNGWGESDLLLGVGEGTGKKDAGMRAAEDALMNRQLIAKYEEMKLVHDEKRRSERGMAMLASRLENSIQTVKVAGAESLDGSNHTEGVVTPGGA